MTHISFTSGEILDIISALDEKAENAEEFEYYELSAYYLNLVEQFRIISDTLEEIQPENRVANLILTIN